MGFKDNGFWMPDRFRPKQRYQATKGELSQYTACKTSVWTGITPDPHNTHSIQHFLLYEMAAIFLWHYAGRVIGERGQNGYLVSSFHQSRRCLAYTNSRCPLLWRIIWSNKEYTSHYCPLFKRT